MPPPSLPRYRTLELCSSGGGYEAVPFGEVRLDLERVRAALERAGVPVVDARVLLIASLAAETTISARGRILVKTADRALAQRVFETVLSAAVSD